MHEINGAKTWCKISLVPLTMERACRLEGVWMVPLAQKTPNWIENGSTTIIASIDTSIWPSSEEPHNCEGVSATGAVAPLNIKGSCSACHLAQRNRAHRGGRFVWRVVRAWGPDRISYFSSIDLLSIDSFIPNFKVAESLPYLGQLATPPNSATPIRGNTQTSIYQIKHPSKRAWN